MTTQQSSERVSRCGQGLHYFRPDQACDCGKVLCAMQRAEGRDGMVTVYDAFGQYEGCMGSETWAALLAEGEAERRADA